MRVLITGGAGFVGSHLADRLLPSGNEVLILDNLTTGQRRNIPDHPRCHFLEGDVQDRDRVGYAFGFNPDVVVHAAASYNDPDNWRRDTVTNTLGTTEVVQACQRHDVGRLIYFQTALCYGTKPDEQPVTLDHPLRPDSSYAISKTAGEQYIANSGLDWVSFRLANCYGPRNLSGPVPTFYKRLSEGEPCHVADTRRDFVYVDDLIEVVWHAIFSPAYHTHGVYHVSSGRDYAIKELYDAVVLALGVDVDEPEVRPRAPGDASTILLDPSRTREHFHGWEPRTSLVEGVRQAVDWYREAGVGETYTHLKIAT